jgi:hypothetical protein
MSQHYTFKHGSIGCLTKLSSAVPDLQCDEQFSVESLACQTDKIEKLIDRIDDLQSYLENVKKIGDTTLLHPAMMASIQRLNTRCFKLLYQADERVTPNMERKVLSKMQLLFGTIGSL